MLESFNLLSLDVNNALYKDSVHTRKVDAKNDLSCYIAVLFITGLTQEERQDELPPHVSARSHARTCTHTHHRRPQHDWHCLTDLV